MKIWTQNSATIMEVLRHTYAPQVKHVWISHITSREHKQFLLNYGKGVLPDKGSKF